MSEAHIRPREHPQLAELPDWPGKQYWTEQMRLSSGASSTKASYTAPSAAPR